MCVDKTWYYRWFPYKFCNKLLCFHRFLFNQHESFNLLVYIFFDYRLKYESENMKRPQKYDKISKLYLNLLINVKLKLEISTYFCGLLRIYELYVFYGFHDFHGFSFLHFYNAKRPIQTYSIHLFSYSAQCNRVKSFLKENFHFHGITFSQEMFSIFTISQFQCFMKISWKRKCIKIRILFHRESHSFVAV